MFQIQQSTTYTKEFGMVSSTDHVTAVTGITPVVTLSKAGAAFAAAAGTVTEISVGWYKIALTIVDTNTLGDLAFHITGTGADPTDFALQIVAFNPLSATNLGLSALPSANPAAAGGLATVDANNAVKLQSGTGANQLSLAAGLVTLTAAEHTAISGTDVPTALTAQGYTSARAVFLDTLNGLVAAVWAAATRTLSAFTFTPNVVNVTGTLPNTTVGGYASGQDPATLVLDTAASSHNTALTIGNKINSAGAGGDPLATVVPAAYGSTTAGFAIGTLLSRLGVPAGASIAADIAAPSNINLSQAVPTTGNTAHTVGDALNAARAEGFGKWTIAGTTWNMYANDGTTLIHSFTLDSSTAPTSRT